MRLKIKTRQKLRSYNRKENLSYNKYTSYKNGGGYTSVRNLQASLLKRWRKRKDMKIRKVKNGLVIVQGSMIQYVYLEAD